MNIDDPYKELGLTEEASAAQVKKTYTRLVKELHPDTLGDCPTRALNEERLKRVNVAYGKLKKGFDLGSKKHTEENIEPVYKCYDFTTPRPPFNRDTNEMNPEEASARFWKASREMRESLRNE